MYNIENYNPSRQGGLVNNLKQRVATGLTAFVLGAGIGIAGCATTISPVTQSIAEYPPLPPAFAARKTVPVYSNQQDNLNQREIYRVPDLDGMVFKLIPCRGCFEDKGVEYIVSQEGPAIDIIGHKIPEYSSRRLGPLLAKLTIMPSKNGIDVPFEGEYFVINDRKWQSQNRFEPLKEGKLRLLRNGKYFIELYAWGNMGTRGSHLIEKETSEEKHSTSTK